MHAVLSVDSNESFYNRPCCKSTKQKKQSGIGFYAVPGVLESQGILLRACAEWNFAALESLKRWKFTLDGSLLLSPTDAGPLLN